mmetsp:Transcript_3067/g.6293  ORF Transcript_3067/g.6293 Transcript_3067/m.6293 type:complete len:315 (-) Transcript_3067:10-954(-)
MGFFHRSHMETVHAGQHVPKASSHATHNKRRHEKDIGDEVIRDNGGPSTLVKQFSRHLASFQESVAMQTNISEGPWIETSRQSFHTSRDAGTEALETFVQAQQRGFVRRGSEKNRDLTHDSHGPDKETSKADRSHGVKDSLERGFFNSMLAVRHEPPTSNDTSGSHLDNVQKDLVGPVEGNSKSNVGKDGHTVRQFNLSILNAVVHAKDNDGIKNAPSTTQELEEKCHQDGSRKGSNRRQGRYEIGSGKGDTIPNNNGICHRKGQGDDTCNGYNIFGRESNPHGTPNETQSNNHHECDLHKALGKTAHNTQQES